MKKYEKLKQKSDEKFKRLVGVKKQTFEKMLEVYKIYHKAKKAEGGRPNKLDESEQILMMLEYYREYRSLEHIAFDYDVSITMCGE
jgi:transposase